MNFKALDYFQVAWKPDGTQLLTASGDKTCKLWDVETRTLVDEFIMGNTVDDQQVGFHLNFILLKQKLFTEF